MMSRPLSWWNLVAMAPILLFLTLCVHSWRKDLQIAKRQQTAIGTIDKHDPPNHDRYGYKFLVNGHLYTGWASPTEKRDFFVGQQIVVYFDPVQPAENSAYGFDDVNRGSILLIGWLLLACVFIPFFIYFQRRSRSDAAVGPTDH